MSTTSVSVEQSRATRLARLADYMELSKPRIGMLVVISVGVAYRVAAWEQPDLLVLANVIMGTWLIAASASALNQWLEWRRDAMMPRTANRPLPTNRLKGREAWFFALATLALGATQLVFGVGWLALMWALLSWLLYVAVYTPLKTRTAWNTAVGAFGGAMPVMIGWSAAGAPYDVRVSVIYLILFLWQFPHFMAIAWMYRRQYDRAGMKMMSVVDPTGRSTALHAVFSAAALLPVSLALCGVIATHGAFVYGTLALMLALFQLAFAVAFWRELTDVSARRLLRASLVYLPIQMALLALVPWA